MAGTRLACSAIVLALGLSGAAGAVTAPAGSTDRLTISISGHITAKCTVAQEGSSDASFGAIMDTKTGRATQASLDLPFSMTCNAPYTATLVSKNGGLAYSGAKANGFSDLVAYDARLGLGGIAGAPSVDCDSKQMAAASGADTSTAGSRCSGSSNRQGYSAGEGRVKLTVRGGGLPLLAGVYSDQLTLLLSPSVSGGEG